MVEVRRFDISEFKNYGGYPSIKSVVDYADGRDSLEARVVRRFLVNGNIPTYELLYTITGQPYLELKKKTGFIYETIPVIHEKYLYPKQ
jgi:hypothetical protein